MATQSIKNPVCMTRMLAPGFPGGRLANPFPGRMHDGPYQRLRLEFPLRVVIKCCVRTRCHGKLVEGT